MLKLAAWRTRRGKTQQWVAEQIGCTVGAVARYEGGVRIPDKATMKKIYVLTEGVVTPNDFYELPEIFPREVAA